MHKNWNILESNNTVVSKLSKTLNVSEIVGHLLVLRGITTFEEAKLFFRPEISHLHDPFLMKNMQKAVDRIQTVIANGEKVLVYGDYDVDGTTSVAMMFSFLKKKVKEIEYYIPCRYDEGYPGAQDDLGVEIEESFGAPKGILIPIPSAISVRLKLAFLL